MHLDSIHLDRFHCRLVSALLFFLISLVNIVKAQEVVQPKFKGGEQGFVNLIGEARTNTKYNHCFFSTVIASFIIV